MSDDTTSEKSPFNFWWAVAGGFLAAVIIALVVVLVVGHGQSNNNAGNGSGSGKTETIPPASHQSTPANTTGCDLPAGGQSIPTSGPAAKWSTDLYLLVPTSSTYGPQKLPDSKWSCFAHSPTGALFAATSFIAGISGPDYQAFVKDAGVQSTAETSWLVAQDPASHQQQAGQVAQIAGFQFESVKNDAVIVSIGFRQNDVEAGVKVSLVWDAAAGNWKADFAGSALDGSAADLSTYTTWAAANG